MSEATDHIERVRTHWTSRAVVALKGNQTKYGCILLAILGKAASNPPRVVSNAIIDENGFVIAAFQDRGWPDAEPVVLDHITDFVDKFRKLTDILKLDDAERIVLFDEVRKWVNEDARAGPSLLK